MHWVKSFLCTVIGTLLCHLSSVNCEDQFGVMLDAGSSGTKLKVYTWKRTEHVTEIPIMDILHAEKFPPGIGKFSRRLADLGSYLRSIVQKAEEFVPEEVRTVTPIYLMATAGARILDGNIALGLLNKIRNLLSNTTVNPFRFKGHNVRILSGEEEGVFAWVAVNALNGFFNLSNPNRESLGVLEMGGGSTQIAFIPQEPVYAGEFQVFIGGRRYDLYVHSYLFFGINYMRERVYNYLADRNPGTNLIENPCMVIGQNATYMVDDTKVVYTGTSSPDACLEILRRFLRKASENDCQPKPCAIGSVYQPHPGNVSFYATQGFVYTPQTLNSLNNEKRLNLSKMQMEAFEYCKMDLSTIMAGSRYDVHEQFASSECLMGMYTPELFLESYQLNPEANAITVSNKLHGARIDWTMGALLYELNTMFQYKKLFPVKEIIPCRNDPGDEPEIPYKPVQKPNVYPSSATTGTYSATLLHVNIILMVVISLCDYHTL